MSLPAWTTVFQPDMTHIVFAQIGIQSKERNSLVEYSNVIMESFKLPNGPIHYDISTYSDSEQYKNHLFMAYWDNSESFRSWLKEPDVKTWWSGNRIDEDQQIGFFSEVATIPSTHIETIHSRENNDSGITHFTKLEKTDVHGYWGSMRKRLQPSAYENLDSDYESDLSVHMDKETFSKRIKVKAPKNICLIRTAQDWSMCSEEEKETYLTLVNPALKKAHHFLTNNPVESGCISTKLVNEVNAKGDFLNKSCVIGFFLSLQHLEHWTHNHATHKAVIGTFFEMLKRHDYSANLSLWHEVSVLQPKDLELEYVNCHPKTGFLPFFETIEIENI